MKKRKIRKHIPRLVIPTVIFLWGVPDASENFKHLADIWKRADLDADQQAQEFMHSLSEDEQMRLVDESLAMQQHKQIRDRIIQALPEQFSRN